MRLACPHFALLSAEAIFALAFENLEFFVPNRVEMLGDIRDLHVRLHGVAHYHVGFANFENLKHRSRSGIGYFRVVSCLFDTHS